MKTLEEKALAACRESAAAACEIKRLGNVISNSLCACNDAYNQMHGAYPEIMWRSHLETAYEFESDDDGERSYRTPEDQMEVLAECPHCLAAHNAIQERKAARKRLGNARRQITLIGRAA